MITIFKNIYEKETPHYITVETALSRIREGKSKTRIEAIRQTLDKEKADSLKALLPSVCFSGKFSRRADADLLEHSNLMVLDFDNLDDIGTKAAEIREHPFVYAFWLSPRGNGLKVLIKIADGKKHRDHFAALEELFPDVDPSGKNESRVCYESYDPNLFINPDAVPFRKTKKTEKITETEVVREDQEIFKKLLVWLSNRDDAFVDGARNNFIFKLAAACCRFGLSEYSATGLIKTEFVNGGTFSDKEADRTIKSAYRANKAASARFEKEILVDKVTRQEVKIDAAVYDVTIKPKDVVYGADVKEQAWDIYHNGYQGIKGVGIAELDALFKPKKGEITLFSGHGNYGKSRFKKWYQVLRAVLYDEKFATFPPEDYPIHSFYHDLTEILLGTDCSKDNPNRPPENVFNVAYDFISEHFFYIYPTDLAPTPNYVKERFLELIIKEKVDGCDIDPFNQMTNDYGAFGGRSDKYLETVLADLTRFAQINNVFMWIVAHPKQMKIGPDGNYPIPNVYDMADGAMWNNKMDNILMYHRPFMQTNPDDPTCELNTKKIRDQRTVGKKGFTLFQYKRKARRYLFENMDPIAIALKTQGIEFTYQEENIF